MYLLSDGISTHEDISTPVHNISPQNFLKPLAKRGYQIGNTKKDKRGDLPIFEILRQVKFSAND